MPRNGPQHHRQTNDHLNSHGVNCGNVTYVQLAAERAFTATKVGHDAYAARLRASSAFEDAEVLYGTSGVAAEAAQVAASSR
jgi:hypothetical protein